MVALRSSFALHRVQDVLTRPSVLTFGQALPPRPDSALAGTLFTILKTGPMDITLPCRETVHYLTDRTGSLRLRFRCRLDSEPFCSRF